MSDLIIKDTKLEGRKLSSTISVSDELSRYLKHRTLFIEYDADVHANHSILNIPVIATLLPLAWLTGSNIHVQELDQTFLESMNLLKREFAKMYPLIPFTTEIKSDKIVHNKINVSDSKKRTGLLFSGGVDSTFSLITNSEKNPKLIILWGVDNFAYSEHSDYWEAVIRTYTKFAEKKNLDFHVIKTNISQILDDRRIEHRFHKELFNGRVRPALQHTLLLLPPVAPLSIGRFNHILMAASVTPEYDFQARPLATRPETDEKIIWADLTVKHDGYILKNRKILGVISDHLLENDLILRVCLKSNLNNGSFNCGRCEKCLRTIVLLVLAGVDPNGCGFLVDESTFTWMRSMWEKMKSSDALGPWRTLQESIPTQIGTDIHGSKAFFEWYRNFDFKTTEKNWLKTDLYLSLPYSLAQLLDKVYRKVGINVHNDPIVRK